METKSATMPYKLQTVLNVIFQTKLIYDVYNVYIITVRRYKRKVYSWSSSHVFLKFISKNKLLTWSKITNFAGLLSLFPT